MAWRLVASKREQQMGLTAECKVVLNGRSAMCQVHCGDGEVDCRGDLRFRWKWNTLSLVEDGDGVLKLVRGDESASIHLGANSAKWAHAIRHPKTRIDKLGLKAGHKYQAWGTFDSEFNEEVNARAGAESEPPLDIVFVRLDGAGDLTKLNLAREQIQSAGMIWAIWPKGRKEFRDSDIRIHGLASGLVDVKVASFSESLSALKFVIPIKDR